MTSRTEIKSWIRALAITEAKNRGFEDLLDSGQLRFMEDYLLAFMTKAVAKYVNGAIEHRSRGFLSGDINFEKEINAEVIDLFWYLSGQDYVKTYGRNT